MSRRHPDLLGQAQNEPVAGDCSPRSSRESARPRSYESDRQPRAQATVAGRGGGSAGPGPRAPGAEVAGPWLHRRRSGSPVTARKPVGASLKPAAAGWGRPSTALRGVVGRCVGCRSDSRSGCRRSRSGSSARSVNSRVRVALSSVFTPCSSTASPTRRRTRNTASGEPSRSPMPAGRRFPLSSTTSANFRDELPELSTSTEPHSSGSRMKDQTKSPPARCDACIPRHPRDGRDPRKISDPPSRDPHQPFSNPSLVTGYSTAPTEHLIRISPQSWSVAPDARHGRPRSRPLWRVANSVALDEADRPSRRARREEAA